MGARFMLKEAVGAIGDALGRRTGGTPERFDYRNATTVSVLVSMTQCSLYAVLLAGEVSSESHRSGSSNQPDGWSLNNVIGLHRR